VDKCQGLRSIALLFLNNEITFMEKTAKVALAAIVLVALAGGLWVAYGGSKGENGPIVVGFIAPLTGDVASIGTVARSATELAVAEVNAAGGINGRQLNVIYEDGQCSAAPANNAASKLMNVDKVTAILGGTCSSETSAFAPAAMLNKTVVLSYCSSAPSLSKTGKYFFRNYPSDLLEGKITAEYAYNVLGVREIYIMYHVSDWGTGLKDVFTKRFTELGGKVTGAEGAPQESRDYRTALGKIKASGTKFVYAPLYTEGSIVAMKQAKELGLTAQMIGGDTWDDPKFQESVKNLGTFIYPKINTPSTPQFEAKLLAATGGKEVPICAAQAYDAVHILANALAKAGENGDALAQTLRTTNYDGVSGHVEFDANGDVKGGSYSIRKIQKGSAETIN